MPTLLHNITAVQRRKMRVRGKLFGTTKRPRVSIERSNMHTYLQAIDDEQGKTIASAQDVIKDKKATGTKTERAIAAATTLAEQLKKQHITAVVFDRGEFRYHGRVRAVAEALRAAGINL
jgi:large subunit ribosomal protein L18